MKLSGKPKEKFSVGLDIGTHSIKIAKLHFTPDSLELIDVSIEPMQPDLGGVLKKLKEAQAFEAVNIALSGPATVIRDINFPKMGPEELKQALKFEAQRHIPFPLQEVNLDGCILKDDLPDNKMLVLLAAVRKEFIAQRIKFLESAGLKANTVEIDSLSLANAFNFNYGQEEGLKSKAVALLNIGAAITNVTILEDGLPRLSRDIPIAGNNFTQKIADTLGVDFKSAEEIKLKPESEQFSKIAHGLEAVFAELTQEIRISFDYYESQSASTVGKIFLSGGGSLLLGLKERLSGLMGIEVNYWEPFKKVRLSASLDPEKVKSLSAQLAVALGLALRQ